MSRAQALLAVALIALPQQELRPQFEARVDAARIQVVAVDADGRFVPGLTIDDFELLVQGEGRELLDVREITVPAAERADAPAPPPARLDVAEASDAGAPAAERRHFVFFLDMTFASRRGVRNAREAMLQMMRESIRPDDRVGLALYSPRSGARWVVPVSGRHDLVIDAMQAMETSLATERSADLLDGVPQEFLDDITDFTGGRSLLEELGRDWAALEVETLMAAIGQISRDLSVLEARKHVVLMSMGAPDDVLADPAVQRTMGRELGAAIAGDVVIHTFFPDRMPSAEELGRSGQALRDRSFLGALAQETGGSSVWFEHSLAAGLRELEQDTRSFYVLSFPMRDGDPDRPAVEVRLRRTDVRVAWSPRFVWSPRAARQLTELQRQLQVAEAIDPGLDPDAVRFDIRLLPLGLQDGRGRMAVLVQLPPEEVARLAADRGDGKVELELLGLVLSPGGQVTDTFRSAVGFAGVDPGQPLRYVDVVSAAPGQHLFKMLVRENTLGRLASRSAGFAVPETAGTAMWMTTPLRVLRPDQVQVIPGSRAGGAEYPLSVTGRQLVPDLEPLAFAGARLHLLVNVGNLQRHPFSGEVQVSAVAGLAPGEAAPLVLEWTKILGVEPAPEPGVWRLLVEVELPRTLPSGAASLLLRVVDAISGQALQQALAIGILGQEPF